MAKSFIKKGDTVVVITGKEKGKTGKVMAVSTEKNRAVVENVNVVSRHRKPRSQEDKGGIIKQNAPLDMSNLMVMCPACSKGTRVARKDIQNEHVRVCKKCGASLDKKFVKAVKKETKKVEKTVDNKTKAADAKTKPAAKTAPAKAKTETKSAAKPVKSAEMKSKTVAKPKASNVRKTGSK